MPPPTTAAPSSTHPKTSAAPTVAPGAVEPDHKRTPGAKNPAVTQATIASTICVAGWTDTVRPPSSYTTALKRKQLASGYAYRGDRKLSDYEEDHLISLELGGSPTSELNLWPEPYAAATGAHIKDKVENKLHDLVCAGDMTLAAAQHAIATDWYAAYKTYGEMTATKAITPTATRSSSAATRSSSAAASPAGATAICEDGSYSYSTHRSGTCSHHGGVKIWL